MDTKTNRLKRAFIRSLPYAIIAAIPITLAAYSINYYRYYNQASKIADSNHDGIVSVEEWKDAYEKAGLKYVHNPTFRERSYLLAIINNQNSKDIPKK